MVKVTTYIYSRPVLNYNYAYFLTLANETRGILSKRLKSPETSFICEKIMPSGGKWDPLEQSAAGFSLAAMFA